MRTKGGDKMPKLYYCEHCHQFTHREGFRFEVLDVHMDTCPVCGSKLRVFEVDHTNYTKIGIPLGITVGIGLFIFTMYISYSPDIPVRDLVINTLFFAVVSVLSYFGIAGGLSLFEPDTAAMKVLEEHPELMENRRKAIMQRRAKGHCIRCDRSIPEETRKCPYCGQEQI